MTYLFQCSSCFNQMSNEYNEYRQYDPYSQAPAEHFRYSRVPVRSVRWWLVVNERQHDHELKYNEIENY